MATILNDQSFDEFIRNAQTPVLIDMWATWCGPCRMLAPVVEEIEEKYAGRLTVGKVDVDECNALAMRYHVSSIPTLMLFKDGELAAKTIGYMGEEELEEFVGKVL